MLRMEGWVTMKEHQGSIKKKNLPDCLSAEIAEDDVFIEDGDDGDKEFMDSLLRFSDDKGNDIFSNFAGDVAFNEESAPNSSFSEYDEESNSMPSINDEDTPYTPFPNLGPRVTYNGIAQAPEQRRSKRDPSNIVLANHVIWKLERLTQAMRRSEISRAKLIPIKRAMMGHHWHEFRQSTHRVQVYVDLTHEKNMR